MRFGYIEHINSALDGQFEYGFSLIFGYTRRKHWPRAQTDVRHTQPTFAQIFVAQTRRRRGTMSNWQRWIRSQTYWTSFTDFEPKALPIRKMTMFRWRSQIPWDAIKINSETRIQSRTKTTHTHARGQDLGRKRKETFSYWKILRNLRLKYRFFQKAINGIRPLLQYDSQYSETIHLSLHTSVQRKWTEYKTRR